MTFRRTLGIAFVLATFAASAPIGSAQSTSSRRTFATGFEFFKYPEGQPVCAVDTTAAAVPVVGTAVPLRTVPNRIFPPFSFDSADCGFVKFDLLFPDEKVRPAEVRFSAAGSKAPFATAPVTYNAAEREGRLDIIPDETWASGEIRLDIFVDGVKKSVGGETFGLNLLQARLTPTAKQGNASYRPGEAVPITGTIFESDSRGLPEERGVPGTFFLKAVSPDGRSRGRYGPFTADATGAFQATLPGDATRGIKAGEDTNYVSAISVDVVDASYDDPSTGPWSAARAGTTPLEVSTPPSTLVLENSFVSSVGWVKPGETYPFRILVKNFTSRSFGGVRVAVAPPDGARFLRATSAQGPARVTADGTIIWDVGSMPRAGAVGPALKTLVVEARAAALTEDPKIVWKDLSSLATLTYGGGPIRARSTSHGPKVIPPDTRFDTARYGDRPFLIVPVDFQDRKHDPSNSGSTLSAVVNSSEVEGSTFNLFQEMSYKQLFPRGKVPSAGIATAGWDVTFSTPRYQDGYQFTNLDPAGVCHGVTYSGLHEQVLPERIHDGWYQLPGTTDYYGDDKYSAGSLAVGLLQDIDSACGPVGKAAYDAAHIADPEVDYSDFDTDKDGVVDFFMFVFTGVGGNGGSQLFTTPPYDNIWPHSSSLESYYTDEETGLSGYISDDQLKDLEGRLLYYENKSRTTMTTKATKFPVYVRVGPYNANPETAVERTSVISHEYGHSLGLPDFYSIAPRATYGDWNLMATDKSQNMDVFGKQELGWLIPRALPSGTSTVEGWKDSKYDTHRIDWVDANGDPYTLQGPGVHNGEAYTAKLPSRQLIDPKKVAEGASPPKLWWSQSGNDFGCTPEGGHNLDVYLPELAKVPAGSDVQVTLKSLWNIEWDYDYGFVLYSTDGGDTYTSLASQNNYTTPAALNPNRAACHEKYGNGLTGSSGSYEAGTQHIDRTGGGDATGAAPSYPESVFLEDSYDLSAAAGKETVLRFSYSTDPGLARPGWFIDDLKVTAAGKTIYETKFDASLSDPRVFNGGCRAGVRVAAECSTGWQYVDAVAGSPADHGYYLELRDRSGFDLNGRGQNDRAPIDFIPGLLLVYTDESHGYGNVGTEGAPAQSPLDSQPQPGDITPILGDAAFTAEEGDNEYSDFGKGHVDNYLDPEAEDGNWLFAYDCLSFQVLSMGGDAMGPARGRGDLTGSARFTLGKGCGTFDYGFTGAVGNLLPDAAISAAPKSGPAPLTVRFSGAGSSDPENQMASWILSFGDGTDNAGGSGAPPASLSHTYTRSGSYRAKLTITDDAGFADSASAIITVGSGTSVLGSEELPATGAGSGMFGLVLVGGSVAASLWLRRRHMA